MKSRNKREGRYIGHLEGFHYRNKKKLNASIPKVSTSQAIKEWAYRITRYGEHKGYKRITH